MNDTLVILGALIPVAVAAVTKSSASNELKALLTVLLAGVATLATGHNDLNAETVGNVVISVVTAVATYAGVWKHVGVNDRLLPGVGLGRNTPTE